MSALLALLAAAALQASPDQDPRWQPFIGCWQATPAEADADASPTGAFAFPDAEESEAEKPEGDRVMCIVPSGDGVSITTFSEGAPTGTRALRPGSGAVEEGGCRGVETTQWSQDGRRLLLSSEMACTGGLERSSRGVLALIGRASLVDVQSVHVAGEEAVRVVRYRALEMAEHPEGFAPDPAQALARETARMHAAQPLSLEAVVETYRAVAAPALEALLAARRAGYALDAATLLRLADAGLPGSTLDVIVALSYPEHFEVVEERPRERVALADYDPYGRRMPWNSGWGSSRYSCYGYSPYSYSPYGCDRYGWGRGSGWIYVIPAGGSGSGQTSSARAVKGRGYTRGDAPATGTARPRIDQSRAGSAGSRARVTPASRSGDSDRAAPSGGSARPTRQAKPRDGG
ncbi:MAG TPA: hypothetical protein VK939_03105 [Longimicrobiales bacterium]|nr:hypothetical protein [Longimicrobiales bacterium]